MNDDLLRELIVAQKEQTELLRRYLWRFRFSLLSLLILTTATAIGLGFLVYKTRSKPAPATATAASWSFTPSISGGSGTLILSPPTPNRRPISNCRIFRQRTRAALAARIIGLTPSIKKPGKHSCLPGFAHF